MNDGRRSTTNTNTKTFGAAQPCVRGLLRGAAGFALAGCFAAPAAAQLPPIGVPYYPPGRAPAAPAVDEAEIVLTPVLGAPGPENLYTVRELFVTPPPREFGPPPAILDEKAQAAFRAATLWADANNAFHDGEYARANQYLTHLRMEQPDHEEAMLLSAQASFALGNDRSAVEELRRAAARPTVDWLAAARNYKTLYGKPVAFADQIYALTRRVKKAAKPNESTLLLACQYWALGYRDEAAKLLDSARAAFPEDPIVERLSSELNVSLEPSAASPAGPPPANGTAPTPSAKPSPASEFKPRVIAPPPPRPQGEVPLESQLPSASREF